MPARQPAQRGRTAGWSFQKHGSIRLFLVAFLILFIPMLLLARLLSTAQIRARELAGQSPEGFVMPTLMLRARHRRHTRKGPRHHVATAAVHTSRRHGRGTKIG